MTIAAIRICPSGPQSIRRATGRTMLRVRALILIFAFSFAPCLLHAHERTADAHLLCSAHVAISVCADFSGPKQFPGQLTFCTEYNAAPDNGNTCCQPADEEYARQRSHAHVSHVHQLFAQHRVEHRHLYSSLGAHSQLAPHSFLEKMHRANFAGNSPLTVPTRTAPTCSANCSVPVVTRGKRISSV